MKKLSENSILQMAASALLNRCDRIALVDVSTYACRFVKHPSVTQEDKDLQSCKDIVTYFKRAMAWGLIHTDDMLECHRRVQQFIANADRRLDPVERTLRLRYRQGDSFVWMQLSLLPVPGQNTSLRLFCLERSEDNTANDALRGVWGKFHKILRINLATGDYEPIKLEGEETVNFIKPSNSIWQWMEEFAGEAHVHPDDVATYLDFIEKLRQNQMSLDVSGACKTIYRRRQDDGWHWVVMEIVPGLGYKEDQSAMLYILDVHDFLAEKSDHNRILREKAGNVDWDDQLASDSDLANLIHSDAGTGPNLIFANLDGLPRFRT